MCAASYATQKLGMIDDASVRRIVTLIEKAGLPTRGLSLDVNAVVDAMFFDKKAMSGKLRLVLPDRIGHVGIRDDVPGELVRQAVQSLRG
jgi:3-dehydroquinate synthase